MKFAINLLLITLQLLSGLSIASATSVITPTDSTLIAQGEDPTPGEETAPEAATDDDRKTELESAIATLKDVQRFSEADDLYVAGDIAAASAIYRQLKTPFEAEKTADLTEIPEAITDPNLLPPQGAAYWRIYQDGKTKNLKSKILIPLEALVTQYPQFIPAQIAYADAIDQFIPENKEDDDDNSEIEMLENVVAQYDDQPEVAKALVNEYVEDKKWLEAAITAGQFALLNPESEQAAEFQQLSQEYSDKYRRHLRAELRGNLIANIITGAAGYFLTGSLIGPMSALDTTIMLLQGESNIGEQVTQGILNKAPMVEDPEVLAYVRGIGNKLANTTGRKDFNYEFYVIMDENLNAFALPGGKVFINAGALVKTKSEAELAGLIAHELSHAILSHGFQLIAEGNLTANLAQFIPFGIGRTATDLLVLSYSRSMEKQADILGTKMLVSCGYAADGLRNLTVTLESEKESQPPAWLSTHPNTSSRVRYLEELIVDRGYNRYAYEGVKTHYQIQERTAKLIADFKAEEAEVTN